MLRLLYNVSVAAVSSGVFTEDDLPYTRDRETSGQPCTRDQGKMISRTHEIETRVRETSGQPCTGDQGKMISRTHEIEKQVDSLVQETKVR